MAQFWVPVGSSVGSGVGSYINLTNAMQCRATEYSLEFGKEHRSDSCAYIYYIHIHI